MKILLKLRIFFRLLLATFHFVCVYGKTGHTSRDLYDGKDKKVSQTVSIYVAEGTLIFRLENMIVAGEDKAIVSEQSEEPVTADVKKLEKKPGKRISKEVEKRAIKEAEKPNKTYHSGNNTPDRFYKHLCEKQIMVPASSGGKAAHSGYPVSRIGKYALRLEEEAYTYFLLYASEKFAATVNIRPPPQNTNDDILITIIKTV